MKKVLLSEINRIRDIMKLPRIMEADLSAGPLPGLARFVNMVVESFIDAPRLGDLHPNLREIGWTKVGGGDNKISLPRSVFEKVSRWVDEMNAGRATFEDAANFLDDVNDVSALFRAFNSYNPTKMKEITQEIVDGARAGRGTDQDFLVWMKEQFEGQLTNADGSPRPNAQKSMYAWLNATYNDPLTAYILNQHYNANADKLSKGTFVVKQPAPNTTIRYNFAESVYNRAMSFLPFWWEKKKQRWIISLQDTNCQGFLGCLWSMRGEAFRGEAALRETINRRLDIIASKVAQGANPVELTSDLDRVINSINNLKRFQSETQKNEFIRYIIDNEYLPQELVDGFKNSDQWKLIQKAIDTETSNFIITQVLVKMGAWVGLNPVTPALVFFKKVWGNISGKGKSTLPEIMSATFIETNFVERWKNLLNNFDPRSKAEIQAIASKHGFWGDQIGTVADFLLLNGLLWPALKGLGYTLVEATYNVNSYNDAIQTLKELCQQEREKQEKIGKTFDCPEIDKLKTLDKGDVEENIKERSFYWTPTLEDGSPLSEYFSFPPYYYDVWNGFIEKYLRVVEGQWTPKKFQDWIETASKDVSPQICKALEKYGKRCDDPELNTVQKQLDALKKYIDEAAKSRTETEIQQQRFEDSTHTDSLRRSVVNRTLGNKESFVTFISAKNVGLDESEKLVPYVWCKSQNTFFAYFKGKSHSNDSDYFCYRVNPQAEITNPSTSFLPCEDWRNQLSQHCPKQPPDNWYYLDQQ